MKADMFFTGDVPWPKIGGQLPQEHKYDIEAAMKAGKMNVEYEMINLKLDEQDGQRVRARSIRRKDTKEVTADAVGMVYTLLQPYEAFGFFKPFLENKLVSLHTGGILQNGKKIWILAKIERDPIVLSRADDDVICKFLLLMNPYDGSTSVYTGFTPIYFACVNALALAVKDAASKMIRVRHTKSVKVSLDAVRDVIDQADQQFTATADRYKKLVHKQIKALDFDKYVREVFKIKGNKLNGQQQRILNTCSSLFASGRTSHLESNKGTAWGAYNAITEYLSYKRGDGVDTRLTSLWFGASARTNNRALDLALGL